MTKILNQDQNSKSRAAQETRHLLDGGAPKLVQELDDAHADGGTDARSEADSDLPTLDAKIPGILALIRGVKETGSAWDRQYTMAAGSLYASSRWRSRPRG